MIFPHDSGGLQVVEQVQCHRPSRGLLTRADGCVVGGDCWLQPGWNFCRAMGRWNVELETSSTNFGTFTWKNHPKMDIRGMWNFPKSSEGYWNNP